jgi:butyryl-CoA dehydrogenase
MDFSPTEEQLMVQKSARDFALREVAPRAKELDKKGIWPADLVQRMAELGFLGMAIRSCR